EGPGQPGAPRLPPEAHRLRADLPLHLPALPLPAGAAAALPRAGPRPLEPAQPLQVFVLVAHLGLLLSDTAQRFRRRVFPFRRLAGFFPAACSPLASTRGSTRAISSRVRAAASSRRDRSSSSCSTPTRGSGSGAGGRPIGLGPRLSRAACNTSRRTSWKRASPRPICSQASCTRQVPATVRRISSSRRFASAGPC